MTLNTSVYLTGPIEPRQAFETAISAVLKAADREGESALIDPDTNSWNDGEKLLKTRVGQGLPAWTLCRYRDDAPLAPIDEYEHEDDEDETPFLVRPACDLEISWDTAYGYKDDGLTCTQLHVLALIELRRTLPDSVHMSWENEYTGEVNKELDGLEEFLGSGFEAMDWFSSIKPILEEIAQEN